MKKTLMENKRVAFHTLGCKVNQYESEALKGSFKKKGWRVVDEKDVAEVYIINTCTVTNLADRKSRQYIRKMKKNNPKSIILVTGCYAQVSQKEVENIEGVNLVVGNNKKNEIINILEDYIKREEEKVEAYVIPTEKIEEFEEWNETVITDGKVRAFVKIQEGCNRFCSYCIIPFARGKLRSRREEDILTECKNLISMGYKELVLTGINTALYEDLENLLKKLDELKGDFRIRLSSLEPTVINEDYVKKILKFKRLCHHLHLSLQSGSDNILKKMNRRYNRTEYMNIAKVLFDFDKYYGITTDIIVGFPDEEDKDFEDTLDLVENVGFCRVHPFKYSKRKGTKAANMENQVDDKIKKVRLDKLISLSNVVSEKFARQNIGTMNRVLFEEVDKNNGLLTGYTDNYIKAYMVADKNEIDKYLGNIAEVRIEQLFEDGVKVIII